MSDTLTTDAANTASHAETYGPWSDGMSDTAPNRFLQTKGMRFAYRAFGRKPGVPVVFLAPLGRNMDFWDPKLTDAFARGHLVLLFDNVGVGLSSGESPKTIAETAKDAATFIDALKELHFTDSDWTNGRIDLLGFSFGGFVAQQFALDRPDLVERVVLAGTAPQGGEGVGTRSPEVAERETASPPTADGRGEPSSLGLTVARRIGIRRSHRTRSQLRPPRLRLGARPPRLGTRIWPGSSNRSSSPTAQRTLFSPCETRSFWRRPFRTRSSLCTRILGQAFSFSFRSSSRATSPSSFNGRDA